MNVLKNTAYGSYNWKSMDVERKVETLCKPQPQDHWAEQIEEWSKPPGDSNEIPTKSHWQLQNAASLSLFIHWLFFVVLDVICRRYIVLEVVISF